MESHHIPPEYSRQTMLKKELKRLYEQNIQSMSDDTQKETLRETKIKQVYPTSKEPKPLISAERNFINGFQEEDFEGFNPILKKAFQLSNCSEGDVYRFKMQMAIRKFQKDENDTGSPVVQCAVLCERILNMIMHMKKKPRDIKAFR